MKRNVNVFIAVVLVAVLCGGVVWLRTADDEKLGWNIHDTYGDAPAYFGGAAYTNATFAGPANDGGVMTLSPSRTMRHGAVSSSYAGAYAVSYGVTHASSPLTSSPLTSAPTGGGLYTTSSKTFNSYGGGGNGGVAMGGAMRGSSSPNSLIASSPITSISSPIAYSTARRGEMSSATGDNPAQVMAENPAMAMANAASVGMGNGFYGGYTAMDYSGSANYGQYMGMFGGGSRMGVRGRQNGGPGNNESNWLNWLALNGSSFGSLVDGVWVLDIYALRSAYDAYCAGWNEMMGEKKPTWDEWLAWFMGSEDSPYVWSDGENSSSYQFLPVGDVIPLLLIALLYIVAMYLRTKSRTQVND